jgi:threonine/homoserine efflux transporter RhtA
MEKNIEPALALIVGILILIQPALLSVIVALYLIVIGVLGLARNLRR